MGKSHRQRVGQITSNNGSSNHRKGFNKTTHGVGVYKQFVVHKVSCVICKERVGTYYKKYESYLCRQCFREQEHLGYTQR
jgi:ribosomal protein S14